jgi:hypothetical protein
MLSIWVLAGDCGIFNLQRYDLLRGGWLQRCVTTSLHS